MSRADLTRCTGISGPTVTRTVGDLLRARLLEEGDAKQPALGRPGKVLHLAHTTVAVLGVVVGVQHCSIVVAGLDGVLRSESAREFATPRTYAELLTTLAQHCQALTPPDAGTLLGVGVSIPGLLDNTGRTRSSPNLHHTDGQRLGHDLAERLGVEVALVQESKALCLAEQAYGEAKGVRHFAMLDICDGMGIGVVHDGQLLTGHGGLAGELGHITVERNGRPCGCGNFGCLETVATDAALVHAVSTRLGRPVSLADMLTGTVDPASDYETWLDYLAIALAAVINLFNPERLFVYGRCLDLRADAMSELHTRTQRRALTPSLADCVIIRARGNKQLGAVASIIQRLTTDRAAPS
jgi:N-acetylglucosamine repressor